VNKKMRIAIGSLALSAAGLFSLTQDEGFTDTAVIPVKGDRPTVCFGMTYRPDGTPVQMGDKCTPVQGIKRTLDYTKTSESTLRECVKVPLHQEEFDVLLNHSYQYGVGVTCKSIMVRKANAGDYAGSCAGYLEYKMSQGYDCSTPGNKRCPGVWNRSIERYKQCLAVQ
jgi:lysozyme